MVYTLRRVVNEGWIPGGGGGLMDVTAVLGGAVGRDRGLTVIIFLFQMQI